MPYRLLYCYYTRFLKIRMEITIYLSRRAGMPHHTSSSSATKGHLIHWAVRYDWLVQCMTFGRGQHLRERMADLLPLQHGDIALDIGCGTGDLAIELAKRIGQAGKIVGIDGS